MATRTKLGIGFAAVAAGLVVTFAGAFFVHTALAPQFNELGEELYAWSPRGWVPATIGQMVSLGGVLLAMAGLTLALLYERPMTWARASLGAALFTGLMLIVFGVIPNEFLTVTQATLEWTPQKTAVTIPPALVLGNDVAISYAALKDILLQGWIVTMFIGIPVFMWWWQGREQRKDAPKPQPVSAYGRPIKVED